MSDVRIQDDLFNYVNKEWIDQAEIPGDKPVTGGFAILDSEVEALLIKEFQDMLEKNSYPDKYLENACKLFSVATNVKKRNKDGIKPALKFLNKFNKIKTMAQFNRNLKDLLLEGFGLPFNVELDVDMMNTSKYSVYIYGPRTILPDSSYYKPGMEAQKEMMLNFFKGMALQILNETKLSDEEKELYLSDTLKFDAVIGSLVKTSEELSEYTKMYNPMTLRRVQSLLKPIKLKKLLLDTLGHEEENIIITDVRFLKGFKELFNENTFEEYKHWAYVTSLIGSTSLLSEKLRDLGGSYMRALMGIQESMSVDKFAYHLVSNVYSEPIGVYYGKKYFGEEAKADIYEMVQEIIDKYKERIKNNPILQAETKEKAIVKLDKMAVKMGYPDKADKFYDKLEFDPEDNLLNICTHLQKIKLLDAIEKFDKPVDRDRWPMPGHMVNACFDPFRNTITFPAAILQAPFYSIKQTRSQNLGGIGAVIGHEISHAFDNNGAKCDEFGNLKNWWTKEDFKKFNQSTKAMIKEFEGIELPWGKVNSTLIVSENIADNGGMAVTLDIMKDTPNKSYEEYFENWGRIWRLKARTEYLQLLLQVDVHAPTILRANMQPRNFDEWYSTYNVIKKDKMYLAPNKRVIIW